MFKEFNAQRLCHCCFLFNILFILVSEDFPFTPRVVTIEKDKKFADSYILGEEIGKLAETYLCISYYYYNNILPLLLRLLPLLILLLL